MGVGGLVCCISLLFLASVRPFVLLFKYERCHINKIGFDDIWWHLFQFKITILYFLVNVFLRTGSFTFIIDAWHVTSWLHYCNSTADADELEYFECGSNNKSYTSCNVNKCWLYAYLKDEMKLVLIQTKKWSNHLSQRMAFHLIMPIQTNLLVKLICPWMLLSAMKLTVKMKSTAFILCVLCMKAVNPCSKSM